MFTFCAFANGRDSVCDGPIDTACMSVASIRIIFPCFKLLCSGDQFLSRESGVLVPLCTKLKK